MGHTVSITTPFKAMEKRMKALLRLDSHGRRGLGYPHRTREENAMGETFVSATKRTELEERMRRLGIAEGELVEQFILGSGKGGQKLNKTASCVYLCHRPTGIEMKCQRSRSRELNRFLARRALCDEIDARRNGEESRRQTEIARIRRQKRRRSRRQKERLLADKHHHSGRKALRRSPGMDE